MTTITFAFEPGSSPNVAGSTPLLGWQQEIVRQEMASLKAQFGVDLAETHSTINVSANIQIYGASLGNDAALVERDSVTGVKHVFVNDGINAWSEPSGFRKVVADALTNVFGIDAQHPGAVTSPLTVADNIQFKPLGDFTQSQLVKIGLVVDTPIHLAAGDQPVAQLMFGLLGRIPDVPGLAAQVDAFHHGVSLATLADNIMASAEGQVIYGNDRAGLFLHHLYLSVLGRDVDDAGFAVQMQALQSGVDPGQIAVNIITGGEATGRIHPSDLFG